MLQENKSKVKKRKQKMKETEQFYTYNNLSSSHNLNINNKQSLLSCSSSTELSPSFNSKAVPVIVFWYETRTNWVHLNKQWGASRWFYFALQPIRERYRIYSNIPPVRAIRPVSRLVSLILIGVVPQRDAIIVWGNPQGYPFQGRMTSWAASLIIISSVPPLRL